MRALTRQDAASTLPPMDAPGFDLLLEDGPVLLVAKPAGVLTQAPPGIDSLEERIKRFLRARDDRHRGVYLGVPHRLDRPVSGAMVFARHVRACRRIAEQFEGRLVKKLYWACVEGEVTPPVGTWRDFLRKIPGQARAEVVPEDHPEGRPATLHYRTLGTSSLGTWLQIELETGRTHQIRVQAASRGHPVLGDEQYGSRRPFGVQHDDSRMRSIALHARSLALQHPITRTPLAAEAPLPEAWRELKCQVLAGTPFSD